MAEWSADQLTAIAENPDLFVSPLREDGTTRGTPTQTWALVVQDKVYVRAANGLKSRWYQAAISQRSGRVRVGGTFYDVTFEPAGDENEGAIVVPRADTIAREGGGPPARMCCAVRWPIEPVTSSVPGG